MCIRDREQNGLWYRGSWALYTMHRRSTVHYYNLLVMWTNLRVRYLIHWLHLDLGLREGQRNWMSYNSGSKQIQRIGFSTVLSAHAEVLGINAGTILVRFVICSPRCIYLSLCGHVIVQVGLWESARLESFGHCQKVSSTKFGKKEKEQWQKIFRHFDVCTFVANDSWSSTNQTASYKS